MTTQRKQFISLEDILAFVFACKCGGEMVSPIKEFKSFPMVCHNCGHDILRDHDSTRGQLEALVDAVKNLKANSKLPFTLKLEITPVPED